MHGWLRCPRVGCWPAAQGGNHPCNECAEPMVRRGGARRGDGRDADPACCHAPVCAVMADATDVDSDVVGDDDRGGVQSIKYNISCNNSYT